MVGHQDAEIEFELRWDINLRANLRLWPEASPNVAALVSADGQSYDEQALITQFPGATAGGQDTRAVRQTFEVLACEGLAYRDLEGGDILRLTPLGSCVLRFLGLIPGEVGRANQANVRLAAEVLIRGLAVVGEYRAIWTLLRRLGNRMTNEELNRAMGRLATLGDVEAAVDAVRKARSQDDVTLIGERIYDPAGFATDREADQRKAINPHFLLAGGGGLFLEIAEGDRRLSDWAPAMIDLAIESTPPLLHPSTHAEDVLQISSYASPPIDLRRKP